MNFNQSWDLITGTETTEHIRNTVRPIVGRGLIQVWQNAADLSRAIITFERKGDWEVYDITIDGSGILKFGNYPTDIGYLSTTHDIHCKNIGRGRTVKIMSPLSCWPTYELVIDQIVHTTINSRMRSQYNITTTDIWGTECISAVLSTLPSFWLRRFPNGLPVVDSKT